MLARGAPNSAKHGIAPLDGLIETDWLPFGFTMNWRFTAPGQVTFERDDGQRGAAECVGQGIEFIHARPSNRIRAFLSRAP
ncbi:MAG: hypothetical protein EB121_02330 [Alphaproteobacteria bacterium]|nr:hypothetical protein [Alphaproteobacteria bacterium]